MRVVQLLYVTSRPLETNVEEHDTGQVLPDHAKNSNHGHSSNGDNEQVISVRVTSSIAIGRGNGKTTQISSDNKEAKTEIDSRKTMETNNDNEETRSSVPPNLEGANMEFLKQLNAKKENKYLNGEHVHPFQHSNETDYDSEKILDLTAKYDEYQNKENTAWSDNISSSSEDIDYYKEVIAKTESTILLGEALKYSNERLISNATDDLLAESKEVPDVITSPTDIDEISNSDINNGTNDSIAESSIKSVLETEDQNNENYENIENVPLARSVLQSPSSKNFIQGLAHKPLSERESSTRLTTVSFNVVHDVPNMQTNTYNDRTKLYVDQSKTYDQRQKFYEHPKVYSQPAQIYSEPAKFYSEPSKVYSEPAKIYSEPAKIYSEPAKVYSEPAKFYSEPASLHLDTNPAPNYSPWDQHSQPTPRTTTFDTTPITTITVSDLNNTPRIPEHLAERNYEVDEKVSVLTDGRSHGVQESTTEKCKQDNCKVGYVVKGRQFNKYRVEERTSDGFIVGEYGVVRNEDGALRGVRYTADSEASPRLIYDALMKFLQLK